MDRVNPDDLRNRIKTGLDESLKRGHVLKQMTWIEYNEKSGIWCGCPIGFTLLYEKGGDAARKLARLADPMCAESPSEFVEDQLNLDYWVLWAFICGFDDAGMNYLPGRDKEQEKMIYAVGNSFRQYLTPA